MRMNSKTFMNFAVAIKEGSAYGSQTPQAGADQVIKPLGTRHTRAAYPPLLNKAKKHEGLQAYTMQMHNSKNAVQTQITQYDKPRCKKHDNDISNDT